MIIRPLGPLCRACRSLGGWAGGPEDRRPRGTTGMDAGRQEGGGHLLCGAARRSAAAARHSQKKPQTPPLPIRPASPLQPWKTRGRRPG